MVCILRNDVLLHNNFLTYICREACPKLRVIFQESEGFFREPEGYLWRRGAELRPGSLSGYHWIQEGSGPVLLAAVHLLLFLHMVFHTGGCVGKWSTTSTTQSIPSSQ